MNKKWILKMNFIFIVLVLLVSGSFIFTGAFSNNKTLQASSVVADIDGTNVETTAISGEDSIADLGGWTVISKRFTKTVGGYTFIIKSGTGDDADKYQLFMIDFPEDIQLTTDFATDYELIDGLIIDGIKRKILFFDDVDYFFRWEQSPNTEATPKSTIVYKTKFLDYNFTLTLSIAVDDNFGKVNLLASDENYDNEVYLLESEDGVFVDETRADFEFEILFWTIGERHKKLMEKYEKKNSAVSFFEPVVEFIFNTNIPRLIASIIGSSIGIGVLVGVCWYFIRNKKPLLTTSSTNKSKNKNKKK